jgi:polyisoprenoid-binding protein YceI
VPHLDQSAAECLVFTYKEGLLSAVAHDLEIRVTRFELDVDEAAPSVTARFDAASLRVVTAMHDGAPKEGALSDGDKQKIEHNLAEDVLHTREHPEIRFASTSVKPDGEGYRIAGELTLHGKTRVIAFSAQPAGDRLVAEVRLHQPDFGVKPYSAMLGTLKVKPDVLVRCSVPKAGLRQGSG